MLCCICKDDKSRIESLENDKENDNSDQIWVSTADRVSPSDMRIDLKLFDCLRREFANPGFVCPICLELIEEIDALQVHQTLQKGNEFILFWTDAVWS